VRSAVRWVVAATGYCLMLSAALVISFVLAWGCHHQRDTQDLLCRLTSPPVGAILAIGLLVTCHAGATALAVLAAPSHRSVVGIVAVLAPLCILAVSMWGQTAVTFSYLSDLVVPVLLVMPGAICALILVRCKGSRRE
jgi:hypothetical protein